MPPVTPFFADFHRRLFGKAPVSALQERLRHSPQVPAICHYQALFGKLVPQELLAAQPRGINRRQRIFSPALTFWSFLGQVLEPGSSCRDALRQLNAWWQWHFPTRALPSHDTSGYCQARERLSDSSLQSLCRHVGQQLEQQATEEQRWLGRRVKIIDGTSVSMPDTAANQAVWPQSSAQKPGCGFPLLKLVGLFSLQSGALLDLSIASQRHHDIQLARQLWPQLQAGDILLADRGFCGFADLAQLQAQANHVVMRLHQARKTDFRRGKPLGPNDRLVVWTKPLQASRNLTKEQIKALPDTLQLRLVRYRIEIPSCRCQEIILVTTLLDAQRFSAAQLAQLYFRRWGVQIKILLGMDVLRCLSPAMVRKELLMHLVAYNLIRALMQRASLIYHVPLQRLSFKGSLDSLHHFADAIHAAHAKPSRQRHFFDALLLTIATDQVPLRPNRSEPRVKNGVQKTTISSLNLDPQWCFPSTVAATVQNPPKPPLSSRHS
jgi:Transposase DDE domain